MSLASHFESMDPMSFHYHLISFLESIDTQDPNLFHFEVVRKTLALVDARYQTNENAIDRLARELLNNCRLLKEHLKKDDLIQENLYPWDHHYLKIVSSIGKTGKSESVVLLPQLNQSYEENSFSFWLSPDTGTPFQAPSFLLLASILWKDRIKKWVTFEANNLPALTTAVYHPLRRLLSTQMYTEATQHHLQIIHEENLIGKVNIPAIPSHLISSIFNGVSKLNSVYDHRLFRFEVQEPFRQLIAGTDDYRVIKLDGGFTELAQRLNLKGKKAITTLKEILYAQAYFEFCCQNFSGNIIQLSKYIPSHIQKDTGLMITVGTLLLPYQTFTDARKDQCALLIPLVHDPPLVGANQYHAGQYALQMDIMAEFSRNSIELSQHDCIKIAPERWDQLAQQSGLPKSLLTSIHDRWTQDGTDGPLFLERTTPNHYTLGKAYNREFQFLKSQGKMRQRRSHAGKKSALKKQENK